MYTKKKDLPKGIQSKEDFQIHMQTFIETHKNILQDLEKHCKANSSPHNISDKKDKLQSLVDKTIADGNTLLNNIQSSEYFATGQEKTKQLLEKLKNNSQRLAEKIKEIEGKYKNT